MDNYMAGLLGALIIALILGSIIFYGGFQNNEHNAEFLCESHNKELFKFEGSGYQLKEVTCFSQPETVEKFVKREA